MSSGPTGAAEVLQDAGAAARRAEDDDQGFDHRDSKPGVQPPPEDIVHLITMKWSARIVLELDGNQSRYSALLCAIPGLSQRVLTVLLHRLEATGIVRRTVYPTRPVRVAYELTSTGVRLAALLTDLRRWARESGFTAEGC